MADASNSKAAKIQSNASLGFTVSQDPYPEIPRPTSSTNNASTKGRPSVGFKQAEKEAPEGEGGTLPEKSDGTKKARLETVKKASKAESVKSPSKKRLGKKDVDAPSMTKSLESNPGKAPSSQNSKIISKSPSTRDARKKNKDGKQSKQKLASGKSGPLRNGISGDKVMSRKEIFISAVNIIIQEKNKEKKEETRRKKKKKEADEMAAFIVYLVKMKRFKEARAKHVSDNTNVHYYDPSLMFPLRKYQSEPCFTTVFATNFPLRRHKLKLEPDVREIKYKYASAEDITLTQDGYPSLVTGKLSEVAIQWSKMDDEVIANWKAVTALEDTRFSFFDELFKEGYVVDSLEVPRSPHGKEKVDNFIEAEKEDYEQRVDYGRVVFKTKHVYMGNFNKWYFEGAGRYVWLDGTTYEGNFVLGVMDGQGTITWPDGCVYDGEFSNGIRSGWGVYSNSEGFTYAGDWVKGLPHGKGKMWYDPARDDSDYFDGEWALGLQNGEGTRQYANGDRYIGHWEDGQRSGTGTMIWMTERQVYKGDWMKGLPNGKGRHIWYLERTDLNAFPTRHVYTGDWVEGHREGIGKMIYPCGSTYEGRWEQSQRNGKGVYINPAGDIFMGLFKDGSIVGGADIPLHAPTYACDYGGLVEWLTVKFSLKTTNESVQEENLSDITLRFLSSLRNLYKRAGWLVQTWGNNGLYPSWKKKVNIFGGNREHFTDEPPHMKGKDVKPPSPDGVHPVTRFGLCLLLKDVPGLTDDATLAFFDKIFTETPSVSFQTRHNPFEPVYLWQFLQCLVIVAVSIYMDIPQRKMHRQYRNETLGEDADEIKNETKSSALIQSISAQEARGKSVKSDAEEGSVGKLPSVTQTVSNRSLSRTKTWIEEGEMEDPNDVFEWNVSESTYDIGYEHKEHFTEGTPQLEVCQEKENSSGISGPHGDEEESTDVDETLGDYIADNARTEVFDCTISQAFEKLLTEMLVPCLSRDPGVNLPEVPSPLPPLKDLYDSFTSINGTDVIAGTEFTKAVLPNLTEKDFSETSYWPRTPEQELLSVRIGLEEVPDLQKLKSSTENEDEFVSDRSYHDPDTLGDTMDAATAEKLLGDSATAPLDSLDAQRVRRNSDFVTEFVSDPLPFSEDDLTAEPFLWDDDPKCPKLE